MQAKVVSSNSAEGLEKKLNAVLEALPDDIVSLDVKFSVSTASAEYNGSVRNQSIYSALVFYDA